MNLIELESTVRFKISDQEDFTNSIERAFEGYQSKYKKFSHIYEVKSEDFKHSIWYNQDNASKIKTKRLKTPKEMFLVNIGLLLLLFLSFPLNRKFGWFDDHMIFVWIYLFLTVPINWIMNQMKPEYQLQLEAEHERLVNYLKSFGNE